MKNCVIVVGRSLNHYYYEVFMGEEYIQHIVKLYKNGESIRAIAKKLKLSAYTVRIYLSKNNIKLRSLEIDILNKKFGKLFVLEKIDKEHYNCKCDCGEYKVCKKKRLLDGRNTSCGCTMNKSGDKNGSWTGYKEITGSFWCSILRGAINRKLEFNLTIHECWELFLKQGRKCALTGIELQMPQSKYPIENNKRAITNLASLDRIDSSLPYTINNVQWVLREINLMKMNLNQNVFIELCRKVSNAN